MNLTAEETELLREILDTVRAELKEEIGKTEDTNYRAMLHRRKELLDSILGKVAAAGVSPGAASPPA